MAKNPAKATNADPSRNNGTNTGAVGPGRPPVETRFQPGNPGRPKGSRNKLAEAFLSDLHDKWQEHGVKAIEAMIADKPGDFVKVVASVMPKELHVKEDSLSDLSDEQIIEFLDTVRALAPAEAIKKASGRASRTEH